MSYTYTDELYHFGINGMKWGVRRYQNTDGSLTPEGRRHYGVGERLKSAYGVVRKRAKAAYDRTPKGVIRTAKTAASLATLGATDSVIAKEKRYRSRKNHDETLGGLVGKGAIRGLTAVGNNFVMKFMVATGALTIAAVAGSRIGQDGAIRAAKILAGAASANIAVTNTYLAYSQVRDTANYVKQKVNKNRRR